MHQAQFVLDPSQTKERAWAQVSKVRNVLWNRFAFGLGEEVTGEGGKTVTVFVDNSPEKSVTPAVIEVAEDPLQGTRTILIQSTTSDSFADLLGAVERNVDAIPLPVLASKVHATPDDVDALERLGLGLVGVRFDRSSYEALALAMKSARAGVRTRAAQIAARLRWRALLRPLWGALARQTPGTPAHGEIASAFATLDGGDGRHRHVLYSEMILEDVITLSRITLDLSGLGLSESRTEASWTVRGMDGQLAWRASEADGVLVLEIDEAYRQRTLGLLELLNVEPRIALLEAASEQRDKALLRLAHFGRNFDPLVDELLVEGLRDPSAEIRLDALIAIATAEWDAAIPDLEDLLATERDLEARQLARAMLMQQRGY